MSPRDTRREFDEIVGRLTKQDPSLARPVHVIPRRLAVTLLVVGGTLIWAGLSVLMVIWGAVGVAITGLAAAVAIAVGIAVHRRSSRAAPGPPGRE
ncbi:DUF3040 domain-containing protein [Actinoplanes sp. NPDC026619]|uniref:DUF3040 domain-containing protein n=1 Tax=Actinoplanes sp. NPDC026619 TaxID=3155798 RepID=UPI0033E2C963